MTGPLDYRGSYRRNLPHIQPPDATFFVTCRLHGTLPVAKLEELSQDYEARKQAAQQRLPGPELHQDLLQEAKRYFGRFDAALDLASSGPTWLRDPRVAQIVADSLRSRDGTMYDVLAYCLMPNHFHLVITPLRRGEGAVYSLTKILHDLKGFTSWRANQVLGRKGKFWQAESYDHVVRDAGELVRIVWYVLQNPVKAGLVEEWEQWPWSYWKDAPT